MLAGSPTSHVSILARARGVQLVVGLAANLDAIMDDTPAILDAADGTLTLHPSPAVVAAVARRVVAERQKGAAAADLLHRPVYTAQGTFIKILTNIDEPGQIKTLSPEICDGVGLTRTEFLFQGSHQPDEEEQLAFYAA